MSLLPEITFKIDLRSQETTLLDASEDQTFAASKTIYIPGLLAAENITSYKHNDVFTLSGEKASYLKRLIDEGKITNIVIAPDDAALELASQKAALTSKLTSFWRFDEGGSGFTDQIGGRDLSVLLGNDFSLGESEGVDGNNVTVSTEDGARFFYNGSPDLISGGGNAGDSDFSFGTWFYSSGDGLGYILSFWDVGLLNSGSKIQISDDTVTAGAIGELSKAIDADTWTHIAYTFSSSTNFSRLYINGESADWGTTTEGGLTFQGIYRSGDKIQYGFFANETLTQEDISFLYNEGNGIDPTS